MSCNENQSRGDENAFLIETLEQAGFLPMKDKMAKKKQAGPSSGQGAHPRSASGASRLDTEAGCNILMVHEVVPHIDRSGTDTRLMQILKELGAQGYRITFVAETARIAKSMLRR
jgi:hypothetical protein